MHTATIRGRRAGLQVRELTKRECEALLRRNRVGRLAFTFHDRVDIEPIHYVYESGWILLRTSQGTKATIMRHNPWVAFETDEVDDVFEWRSVVVHGAAYPLDESTERVVPDAYERALEQLRRIVPESGTPDDPVPWRDRVFHIRISRMTGRRSSTQPRRMAARSISAARKQQWPKPGRT